MLGTLWEDGPVVGMKRHGGENTWKQSQRAMINQGEESQVGLCFSPFSVAITE